MQGSSNNARQTRPQGGETCASLRDRSVSPHQLRHSCAVVMLQATHDIRKVALWLGHADIRTTEVYLRMDPSKSWKRSKRSSRRNSGAAGSRHRVTLIASLLSDLEAPV